MNIRDKQVGIRMPVERWQMLSEAARLRGEDISDFARRAIYTELARLSYLSVDEKKALGVS